MLANDTKGYASVARTSTDELPPTVRMAPYVKIVSTTPRVCAAAIS